MRVYFSLRAYSVSAFVAFALICSLPAAAEQPTTEADVYVDSACTAKREPSPAQEIDEQLGGGLQFDPAAPGGVRPAYESSPDRPFGVDPTEVVIFPSETAVEKEKPTGVDDDCPPFEKGE